MNYMDLLQINNLKVYKTSAGKKVSHNMPIGKIDRSLHNKFHCTQKWIQQTNVTFI